jgi:hypothetical protein
MRHPERSGHRSSIVGLTDSVIPSEVVIGHPQRAVIDSVIPSEAELPAFGQFCGVEEPAFFPLFHRTCNDGP